AVERMQSGRRAIEDRMWGEIEREDAARYRTMQLLSLVSPAALFESCTSELANTGELQRELFMREARTYDATVGRRLAESRHVVYSLNEKSSTMRAMVI